MALTEKQQKKFHDALLMLEFDISEGQQKKIEVYLSELMKWNQVYNLTGFKEFEQNLVKNILDSLSPAQNICGSEILDLGTGAGLPGLLLAIINEQQQWTLMDANGKKIRFLEHIKQKLSLQNVQPIHSRLEDFEKKAVFDAVCTRAFDSLSRSLVLSERVLKKNARFYALKGKVLEKELESIPVWAKVENILSLKVPLLNEERHLITCICHEESNT